MLDMDKYAGAVYMSWVVTLGLLALLALVTWRQSKKARAEMEAAEERRKARHG